MERRQFFRNTIGWSLAFYPFSQELRNFEGSLIEESNQHMLPIGLKRPVNIYNNWSSYDELSDNIPLTEELAMRELQELIRLKKNGVHFDYYVMDAFWFSRAGGYRTWNRQHWPNGPDKWLQTCKDNDIKPGMWFSTNLVATRSGPFLDIIPEWKDSLATDPNILCLFSGGYLRHLAETLQIWADKGVRLFKFDFAYFFAATEAVKKVHIPSEIEEMNRLAFMDMLKQFRYRNPEVLITGYNGFGGEMDDTVTDFRKTIDPRWMDVFDTLYSGDPRISDVPAINFWRSQDIYSDHMVRQFEFNGLPLQRIDNCGFMIGKTGTCYYRANHAWKSMLIMELARGGWANVYHGNLELLGDTDASWFAKTQQMFNKLQRYGTAGTFGAIPGHREPYGFMYEAITGKLITVVNPTQGFKEIILPVEANESGSILFTDEGFRPELKANKILLGPEQMAVTGWGEYADRKYDLGIEESNHIPNTIEKLNADFKESNKNQVAAKLNAPAGKNIRILLQQFGADGLPHRSWGGAPPDGKKMDEMLRIEVIQNGKKIPLRIQYDKMIWSGLSWGAAELPGSNFNPRLPLDILCSSSENDPMKLRVELYACS